MFPLNVGRSNNTATYYSGSGTNNIVFKYVVFPNHWSLALSYDYQQNEIESRNGYIRQRSHNPTTDANLTLPSPRELFPQNSSNIQIDGRTPAIVDIFVSDGQSSEFIQGNNLLITVEFSSEATFHGGPPVLWISIGAHIFGEASYISGDKSTSFEFIYSVAVGDLSPPNPFLCRMLCVSSGCVEGVSTEGYIKQYSSISSLDADLTLPLSSHGKKHWLPVQCKFSNQESYPIFVILFLVYNHLPIYSRSGDIQVNTTGAPETKIASITSLCENTIVTIGEVLRFQVTFTDAVWFVGEIPKLQLNTNSTASYESGKGTSVWIFRFVTSNNDITEGLNWSLLQGKNAPIHCDPNDLRPCSIANANDVSVDLSVVDEVTQSTSIPAIDPTIIIDSTPSPCYCTSQLFGVMYW